MMTADEWNEIESEIVRAWSAGDLQQALRQIDAVLDQGSSELRGRALLYRGSIREEEANWAAARGDFTHAVDLLPVRSYARYAAALSVASTCEKLNAASQAVEWYRAALATCATADEPFSGALALKRLMSLEPVLSADDMQLAKTVASVSWQTLGLPGEPDLENLQETTKTLLHAASHPQH